MNRKLLFVLAASGVALAIAGCSTQQQRVGGAGVGAVTGAAVGGPAGAVAGGVVGAATGPTVARETGVRTTTKKRVAKKRTRTAG